MLDFLEGRQGREINHLPLKDRRKAVLDCFVRFFGPRAARPGRYIERSWGEEPRTRLLRWLLPTRRMD